MTARTIVVARVPCKVIWHVMRDRMEELASYLPDIERIESQSRETRGDGILKVVSLWRARPNLPPLIASNLKHEVLEWTDRADWREAELETHWQIEPHFLSRQTEYSGTTRFAEALGGKGTRLTFEVDVMDLNDSKGIGSIVTTIIQRNFRELVGAATRLAEAE